MTIVRANGASAFEPSISIIIPAVNEAKGLGETIAAARSSSVPSEVIVVDADSSDSTTNLATISGARVVRSRRRQRAHQLNLGAQHARAATLLFLHADTILPSGALDSIAGALQTHGVAGGAFIRRYASSSRFLGATCLLARCRNHLIGWHLGDQAMFVRRAAFFQLGGFRDVDQFEDLDFSRRLKRFGKIVTLTPCVTSSSRRFSHGAVRTTARDLGLTMRYLWSGLPEPHPGTRIRQTALS